MQGGVSYGLLVFFCFFFMCAQEAPSARRSTTVRSRGALLNEVLRYTNAARAATRRAGGGRRTSDSKEKGKENQPVSRYSRT